MRYRGLSRKNGYKLINSDSKRRKPGNAAIVQRFPKTDTFNSEFAKINNELEIVYLKMGNSVIIDKKSELATWNDNGIPRYNWAGQEITRTVAGDSEQTEPEVMETQDSATVEESQAQEVGEKESASQDTSSHSGEGVYISFDSATDEELEEAIAKIRAEQRARLKTKIVLSETELTVAKGKNAKITAEVVDIPEDQKASKITWTVSDKNIVNCQNGSITAKGNGQATISASCTLTDGTEVTSDCVVNVYTPVTGLQANKKNLDIGVDESVKAEVTVQPKDASNTALKWESSDPSVASVGPDGTITGVGSGTATITATTTDGTEKQVAITVKSTKKDDRGKTLTNSDGISLTVLNVKETKGSSYAKAEAGNTFVLIELQIDNNSSEDLTVNSTFGFDAICDDYKVDYSFSADLNTNNQFSTSDVKPGRKIKGWKGFEVPQNWKELIVTFTPNASMWGSGDKIEFVLYNTK